jgi:hypothetical protein
MGCFISVGFLFQTTDSGRVWNFVLLMDYSATTALWRVVMPYHDNIYASSCTNSESHLKSENNEV